MANQEAIRKVEAELTKLKEKLDYYIQLIKEDGVITDEEQGKLNLMQDNIAKVEIRLSQLKTGPNTDPIRWGDLKDNYHDKINIWINSAKSSSEEVKGYITDENEEKNGTVVANAMLNIIKVIGKPYAIAVEVLRGAVGALSSSPTNTLTEFHSAWMRSLDNQKGKTPFKLFQDAFKKEHLQGCTENQITHSTALIVMKNYLRRELMPPQKMKEIYLKSWIDSAVDQDDHWYSRKDGDAGYVCIEMRYICPVIMVGTSNPREKLATQGTWDFKKAYLDDMPRPSGTNEAILGVHQNKTLIELPYKVVVRIDSEGANGGRGINLTPERHEFEKREDGKWYRNYGSEQLFLTWYHKQSKLYKVKDLGIE